MYGRRKEQGFTLIEVLVALAIIAVAMAAAVRVAGLMTQSNGLLRDKSIALLAAQVASPNCAWKATCVAARRLSPAIKAA